MTTETQNSVGHRPAGKWQFDSGVTDCFDDMLRRSIPDFDMMRRLTLDLGSQFVKSDTAIVDLGCSRGDGLKPFAEKFGSSVRYVGLDESQPMIEAAKDNMVEWGSCSRMKVHDITTGLPPLKTSLVLSILTLQFTPAECRQKIVADAYRILDPGGAMILVEKTLGHDSKSDQLLVNTYLTMKASNGYSSDDIEAKPKSSPGGVGSNDILWKRNHAHCRRVSSRSVLEGIELLRMDRDQTEGGCMMGARGPKPQPSELLKRRGTFRADRAAGNEATSIGVPKFLADISDKDVKREFKRLSKVLVTMGLVGEADSNVMTRYAIAWVRWRRVAQILLANEKAEVATYRSLDGKVKAIQVSALNSIARALSEELSRMEAVLGMNPSARSRIEVAMTTTPPAMDTLNRNRFFDQLSTN